MTLSTEGIDALLIEADEDLPLLMDEYPNGARTTDFAEYYGIPHKMACKAIGILLLRGILTVQDATIPERYIAAERTTGALGVAAGHIATLLCSKTDSVLEEIKAAVAVGRITHTQEGKTFYVRSLRDSSYRKPSDWITAKDKKEPTMSNVTDIRQKAATAAALPPASSPTRAPPPAGAAVERSTVGLRNALFDALDELRGPKPDIQRALATAKLAQAIINTAKAEMDFHDRMKQDKDLERNFQSGPVMLGSTGS